MESAPVPKLHTLQLKRPVGTGFFVGHAHIQVVAGRRLVIQAPKYLNVFRDELIADRDAYLAAPMLFQLQHAVVSKTTPTTNWYDIGPAEHELAGLAQQVEIRGAFYRVVDAISGRVCYQYQGGDE